MKSHQRRIDKWPLEFPFSLTPPGNSGAFEIHCVLFFANLYRHLESSTRQNPMFYWRIIFLDSGNFTQSITKSYILFERHLWIKIPNIYHYHKIGKRYILPKMVTHAQCLLSSPTHPGVLSTDLISASGSTITTSELDNLFCRDAANFSELEKTHMETSADLSRVFSNSLHFLYSTRQLLPMGYCYLCLKNFKRLKLNK